MTQKRTRKIVEGAAIAAIFGTLFLLDVYMGGLFGYYLCFILPSLIVWYGYKYSVKDSLTLSLVVLLITVIVASPFNLYYAIVALLVGISMSYCIKKQFKPMNLFMITIVFTLLSNVLMYTLFAKVFEMNLIEELTYSYDFVAKLMPNVISFDTIIQLAPLFILFMAVIEAYIMILVMLIILPKLKVPFSFQFNFLLMRFPPLIGVVFVFVIIIGKWFKDILILNYLITIIKTILVIQGVSLAGYWFGMSKKPWLYFLSMICAFIPYCWFIYGILGLIDIIVGIKTKLLYNKTINKG